MIIRTGSASVQVDTLADGVERVRALAARVGGFVANTQMQAGPNQIKSATLEIRLPSSRFDQAIDGLTPLGHVESVNVQAEDVGEEFVDVTARAANSRRLEERLIQVLETKTGKLKDVLDVERELARVREDIERMDGRLRYLRARTSVSSLSITVHEAYPVVGQRGSGNVIADAFRQIVEEFRAVRGAVHRGSGDDHPHDRSCCRDGHWRDRAHQEACTAEGVSRDAERRESYPDPRDSYPERREYRVVRSYRL